MPHVTRRDILKGLSTAGIAGAFAGALPRMVFGADPQSGPILVVLHMRGGCDGLQFVSPASDKNFIEARISELRVSADGKDAGYALANAPAPDIDFRLHANAGGMAELYKGGHLAFIHACGLTDSTRSHFVATDMIEHGVGNEKDLLQTESGWLARALGAGRTTGRVQAIAVNGVIPGDLQGFEDALAVPNLSSGIYYIGGPPISSVLWSMYSDDSTPVGEAGRRALQMPVAIDQKVLRDAQGHYPPYQAENGANYDSAGGIGNQLKTVAQLVKMDIGLRAITLDYGNWDTHEYQAGRFGILVGPLAGGLAAFWNDLAAYHDRVTVVMVTEFGRRLRSNKSNGTDHGRGSLMAVLGGKVAGGKFYGKWPGLDSAQLDEGVDLAVTTDYRQVFTEILNHTEGKTDAKWFPNYRYPGALGLFA